jgi:hypothetical protein
MTRFLILVSMLGLFGCDSASDASCTDCKTGYTSAECDSFAKSQGCASGEAVPAEAPFCQGTAGALECKFHGCEVGKAIMCQTGSGDSGTD